MSVHDDDILDFDFLEEGATRETPPRARPEPPRRTGGGGPRPPRLRGGGGTLTPLLRLVGLVAFAILVVVLLAVWAEGCASDGKRDGYADYLQAMGTIGADSAKIGDQLGTLLTTPGLKQAELEKQLGGRIQQQQQGLQNAERLDPPGPVRQAHEAALDALRFRVSGMQGVLASFVATKASKDAAAAGDQLSAQGQRLITSDVVWADLFRQVAEAELEAQDVTGVAVPASVFLDNPDLVSPRSMTAIWQRVHGASTGGTTTGLHGTGLGAVIVQPGGTQLSTTAETTIVASTDLAFEVNVTNTGDNQEVSVKVDLTIPNPDGQAITKRQTIDLIDPGETKTVRFADLGDPPFGEKLSIKVDVNPVQGETNTTNNTAEFPVIFSLDAP